MQRLSSAKTGFYKRIFPSLRCGFIPLFLGFSRWAPQQRESTGARLPDFTVLSMRLHMAGFGLFTIHRLIIDFIGEVCLDGACSDGDFLVVKILGETHRFGLADEMNVNAITTTTQRRITVIRRTTRRFCSSVGFMLTSPRGFLGVVQPISVAIEVSGRVDAARQAA